MGNAVETESDTPVTIKLRAETTTPIEVDIEIVRQIILYIARNRAQSARQIAWDLNQPQNLIHATLESVREAHDLVLRGFVAISDLSSTARWYRDLREKDRKRVPVWNGVYPTYHGPLPVALQARPDLHPVFLKGADAIFRSVFIEKGATPLRAKQEIAERIGKLVTRLTTEDKVRSFEDLSRVYDRRIADTQQLTLNLEQASASDMDDETIDPSGLIGFSDIHPVSPEPVPAEPEIDEDVPEAVVGTVEAEPETNVSKPKSEPLGTRGRNQKGAAPSYTESFRRGRIAIMSYVTPEHHARLKAWAQFTDQTMQSIAAEAIEKFIDDNGIPELDEY